MKKGTTVAKKVAKPEALEPRIHIDEFLKLHSGLNEIRQSGFRALSKGKVWMRKSQWEEILKQYIEGV
ncbi:gp8.1 [Bacillus phage SPO1]|uniref:Gp8.1 n=1 Tax=Bacillus phage SP01 TaxID=2884427 RepID=B6V2P3_BPSP1|nr:gp8.1 [Bacillus phage SPO1]ACI90984.1 gp8.1 [Bacillus phage SPO1]